MLAVFNSRGDLLFCHGDINITITLSNGSKYILGLYKDFPKYRIKKGFLYKGPFKKLGRITHIREG